MVWLLPIDKLNSSDFDFFKSETIMKVRIVPSQISLVLPLMLGILFFAWKEKVTNPQFQPEITNATDNFQFQVTAISNVSQTLRYAWNNTGTVANVNQSCSMTGGTATLTITDASGNQVYSRNMSDNGTFVTSTGIAGSWTIQAVLSKCSGTLNFRAQKRT